MVVRTSYPTLAARLESQIYYSHLLTERLLHI